MREDQKSGRVESTGVENVGGDCRGGNHMSGKRRRNMHE